MRIDFQSLGIQFISYPENVDTSTPVRQKREPAIEAWILAITKGGGAARFDGLHIDQIDELWKPREMWIQGGIEAFRLASMVRDRHKIPFIVGLGFSLESEEEFSGGNFLTEENFMARVDWSPPSLYLFEPGKGPRIEATVVRKLNRNLFPDLPETASCYSVEFREVHTNEQRRSVFVES